MGAPVVTSSSIRQNTFGGVFDSQVSGNGSILHQFITEGVEEDTIDDECRIPVAAHSNGLHDGVSPKKQHAFHNDRSCSQDDDYEKLNIEHRGRLYSMQKVEKIASDHEDEAQ